jgi:hypothetical protein
VIGGSVWTAGATANGVLLIDADVKLAIRYIKRRQKNCLDFGQTITETAAACKLPVDVVRLYERRQSDSCRTG